MGIILSAVAPVFAVVGLGYGLARVGILTAEVGTALVRFMFYVAIPAMLFKTMAGASLGHELPWDLLLAFYGPSVGLFLIAGLIYRRLSGWPAPEASVMAMSASYSNIVLLGFPLVLAAFGGEVAIPLMMLLGTQSVILFPLVVLSARGDGSDGNTTTAGNQLLH